MAWAKSVIVDLKRRLLGEQERAHAHEKSIEPQ